MSELSPKVYESQLSFPHFPAGLLKATVF